jgi:hypothetical protein
MLLLFEQMLERDEDLARALIVVMERLSTKRRKSA